MQFIQVTPSPAPNDPLRQLRPIAPDIDMTWIWTGIGALACLAVACVFLFLLVQNLRGYGSAPAWFHVIGMVGALAATFILGTISTNAMWEPIKPLAQFTGPGALVLLIGFGLFVFANSDK
ncbi:hypothetical protein A6A22_10925 [Arthrobacter sp. OY3WO11]|nr:hypothetical protein A6A22_10925 [Arthrobacter sp. OY3WO11]